MKQFCGLVKCKKLGFTFMCNFQKTTTRLRRTNCTIMFIVKSSTLASVSGKASISFSFRSAPVHLIGKVWSALSLSSQCLSFNIITTSSCFQALLGSQSQGSCSAGPGWFPLDCQIFQLPLCS